MSRFKPQSKERRSLENLIFGTTDLPHRTARADKTRTRKQRFRRLPIKATAPTVNMNFSDQGIFAQEAPSTPRKITGLPRTKRTDF